MDRSVSDLPPPTDQRDKPAPRRPRPAPEMQVVTKGWWTLREETAPAEILQREEMDER